VQNDGFGEARAHDYESRFGSRGALGVVVADAVAERAGVALPDRSARGHWPGRL